MAGELKINIDFVYRKTGQIIDPEFSQISVDVSGSNPLGNTQIIGISAYEALVKGDVGTIGYVIMKNLDSANFVELSMEGAGTSKSMKLKAGEFACLRWNGTNIYAQADTAPVNLKYILIPD